MDGRNLPRLAIAALVGLTLLAGCAQSLRTVTSQTATSLHVIRTSAFPSNHIPPFERTATDAAKVQRLYNALLALPTPPPGPLSCPVDFGVAYHVTFFNQSVIVLQATVKPDGCRSVSLSNGESRWAMDDQFWAVFADTIGAPESVIYPVVPQPTGPSAPTAAP
jgi:hypothetical protein